MDFVGASRVSVISRTGFCGYPQFPHHYYSSSSLISKTKKEDNDVNEGVDRDSVRRD